MADVQLNWAANPADENVTQYIVYRDGAEIARPNTNLYLDQNLTPAEYTYQVAAIGAWGVTPLSDSVRTPKPATTPQGLVAVVVNVTINLNRT